MPRLRRQACGRGALLALVALLAVGARPAAAQPGLSITAAPALFPAFNSQVPNYVARCGAAQSLQLVVSAPPGVAVAVDGGPSSTGSFTTSVPVSSGQSFMFIVTAGGRAQRYRVRCLPSDFPRWTVKRLRRPQAGWFVVAPCCTARYAVIFDSNGVPMWWLRGGPLVLDASLLPGDDVNVGFNAGGRFGPGVSLAAFDEFSLDGIFQRTFTIPGGVPTDRHELQVLPNGDYIVVAHLPRSGVNLRRYGGPAKATVLDAYVAEVSPQGRLVWSWDSRYHIKLSETAPRWYHEVLTHPAVLPDGSRAYDIVHVNAVAPYGRGFLISLRHTDAVYAVDTPSGGIRWKLGGSPTSKSLRIIGDNVYDFGGQHDVRALPDGTVTVHDNGTGLGRRPRALRFRINAKRRTATLIERLVDYQTPPTSSCCGSARKLPTGDWVIDWGGWSFVSELTPRDKPVFVLRFPGESSYRAQPLLPGALSRGALDADMDYMHPRPAQ